MFVLEIGSETVEADEFNVCIGPRLHMAHLERKTFRRGIAHRDPNQTDILSEYIFVSGKSIGFNWGVK